MKFLLAVIVMVAAAATCNAGPRRLPKAAVCTRPAPAAEAVVEAPVVPARPAVPAPALYAPAYQSEPGACASGSCAAPQTVRRGLFGRR